MGYAAYGYGRYGVGTDETPRCGTNEMFDTVANLCACLPGYQRDASNACVPELSGPPTAQGCLPGTVWNEAAQKCFYICAAGCVNTPDGLCLCGGITSAPVPQQTSPGTSTSASSSPKTPSGYVPVVTTGPVVTPAPAPAPEKKNLAAMAGPVAIGVVAGLALLGVVLAVSKRKAG